MLYCYRYVKPSNSLLASARRHHKTAHAWTNQHLQRLLLRLWLRLLLSATPAGEAGLAVGVTFD